MRKFDPENFGNTAPDAGFVIPCTMILENALSFLHYFCDLLLKTAGPRNTQINRTAQYPLREICWILKNFLPPPVKFTQQVIFQFQSHHKKRFRFKNFLFGKFRISYKALLGGFAQSRKASVAFIMSVRVSAQLPLDGFP